MTKPFESEFRIIIPRRKNVLKIVETSLSKRFGGTTTFPVKGAWIHKGNLVYDNNYLIFTTRDLNGKSPKILEQDRKFLNELAKKIAVNTGEKVIWTEEDIIRDVNMVKNPKLNEVI